jgi:flavin reductase (DIM6/NTAB) family NADH-FMN oxidoreductase RutF
MIEHFQPVAFEHVGRLVNKIYHAHRASNPQILGAGTMNEHFRPVASEHASRLINHGPTVLVTSADGGGRNVMAAAWSLPVEFTPPRVAVAVVIDKRTYTRELITASGAFGLCIPGAALVGT